MNKYELNDYKNAVEGLLAPVISRKEVKLEWDELKTATLYTNGECIQKPSCWLSIYFEEPLNNQPVEEKDFKWTHLCSQNVFDFTPEGLANRIVLILVDRLRSKSQDINGLMLEYNLIRK